MGDRPNLAAGASLLAVGLVACVSESVTPAPPRPIDAAGSYTIALTNDLNGCQLGGWTPGDTANGVPFDVAQTGTVVGGSVGGSAGVAISQWLGSAQFQGTASDKGLTLTNRSNASSKDGLCEYGTQATIDATLRGDVLTGTITYVDVPTKATASSCGLRNACTSVQRFDGIRIHGERCTPTNCLAGCCDANGVCRTGNEFSACGAGGRSCDDCGKANYDYCDPELRQCAKDAPCSSVSCPTGCCLPFNGKSVCVIGTSGIACGAGASACADCSASSTVCDAPSHTCVAPP